MDDDLNGFTVDYDIPGDIDALVTAVEVECIEDGTANVTLRGLYGAYDPDHALALAAACATRCAQAAVTARVGDAPLS